MMRTLRTPRLLLEPLVRRHAPELFDVLADPLLYELVDDEPPTSVARLAERYARLESRRSVDGAELWLNWVVRETATQRVIGYVQAAVRQDRRARVSSAISPHRWRWGFGREAARAVLGELASGYKVKRFAAHVDPRNAPAINLLRALGFDETGEEGADLVFETERPTLG